MCIAMVTQVIDSETSSLFLQEFDLIEKKELAPLQDLIERLTSYSHSSNLSMPNAYA